MCRVVSCRVVSCRVVSCRVVSCRVVSCRVVSCRVVSCRVVSCRVVSNVDKFVHSALSEYGGCLCKNSRRAVITKWLNTSKRSQDDVPLNGPAIEKVWAPRVVPMTGHCIVQELM